MAISWAGTRRIAFLVVWLIIAALFGLGAEAILSLEADAFSGATNNTPISESDSVGKLFSPETNEALPPQGIRGFEDVVFGLGIQMETHTLMNRDVDSEFDAVVEYINKSCDDPDEMMSVSMCIA
jgi:hypothetical protein